jgi:hypothetical protein
LECRLPRQTLGGLLEGHELGVLKPVRGSWLPVADLLFGFLKAEPLALCVEMQATSLGKVPGLPTQQRGVPELEGCLATAVRHEPGQALLP